MRTFTLHSRFVINPTITLANLLQYLLPFLSKKTALCCAHLIPAGNVGNLPLVIVATLCGEPKSLFATSLHAKCEEIGIAYVAFSMWVAGFVQYSVAYNLMKLPDK